MGGGVVKGVYSVTGPVDFASAGANLSKGEMGPFRGEPIKGKQKRRRARPRTVVGEEALKKSLLRNAPKKSTERERLGNYVLRIA